MRVRAAMLDLADVNGDGRMDIVTGDRFWGHVPVNPNFADPSLLVWFELQRGPSGATFVPHVIDSQSGVGCQVTPGNIDRDVQMGSYCTTVGSGMLRAHGDHVPSADVTPGRAA